jgi:hypothetical protein
MTLTTTALTLVLATVVTTVVASTMADAITDTYRTCTVPASLTKDLPQQVTPPPPGPSCVDQLFGR